MKKILVYGIFFAGALALLMKPKESVCLERPLLVAHRGANRLADENTLTAYDLAARHGMDYFECDPRLTKDGVFVIMHDGTVDRTTNGSGKVAEMTLEQVKSLRTKKGDMVPTLTEAIELAKEKEIGIYMDTKLKDISDIEKLTDLVMEKGMEERVVIGLWTRESQVWMEKNRPEIKTSVAFPLAVTSAKHAKKIGAEWIGMIVPQASPSKIEKANRYGLKVITLPINDKNVMEEKVRAGLHVLQTDDPVILKSVIDELFSGKGDS